MTQIDQRAHTTFHVESWSDEAGFKRVVVECMGAYQKMWAAGASGARGVAFDPDMKIVAILIRDGVRRFVTARINGEIVAMQNWMVVDDIEARGRRMAHMTGIWKSDKGACDTAEFMKFGVAAMRAAGCTHIILSCYQAAKGLREKMEQIGAKAAEIVMEM